MRPPFYGVTCKGSYALGSACGKCERCAWERNRDLPRLFEQARARIEELECVEANLADYARNYFQMFDLYLHSWLRNIGGVIRPKHHQIDGFALRTQDIYEKAKLVDRIKKIMSDEMKREGATKDTMFDAVFRYLAEDGHDQVPTN